MRALYILSARNEKDRKIGGTITLQAQIALETIEGYLVALLLSGDKSWRHPFTYSADGVQRTSHSPGISTEASLTVTVTGPAGTPLS